MGPNIPVAPPGAGRRGAPRRAAGRVAQLLRGAAGLLALAAALAAPALGAQPGRADRLPTHTRASLPPAGTPGRLVLLTDGDPGLLLDSGTQWVRLSSGTLLAEWFGARCDGRADDTPAFAAALALGSNVAVPAGTCRITSGLRLGVGQSLTGAGYGANDTGGGRTVLLKDGHFHGVTLAGDGAQLADLEVRGAPGNAGDGVVVEAGRTVLRNLTLAGHGGNGVHVGAATPGKNVNLWRAGNLISRGNGGHGLYVHDAGAPPNVNAGVAVGLDLRGNAADGLRVESAFDNTFHNVVAQQNRGHGVRLLGRAKGNAFWYPYTEANQAGAFRLDPGSQENIVFGTRQGVVGDEYRDEGLRNLVVGRISESLLWHVYGQMEFRDLRVNDAGSASGQWSLRQNARTRDLEVALLNTQASPVDVALTHDQGGTVRLRAGQVAIGGGAYIVRHTSQTHAWDPPPVADRAAVGTTVSVAGAAPGDTCVASFDRLDGGDAVLSCHVASHGGVRVTLLNATGQSRDLPAGTLRVDLWKH
jgi:hypothetical protein